MYACYVKYGMRRMGIWRIYTYIVYILKNSSFSLSLSPSVAFLCMLTYLQNEMMPMKVPLLMLPICSFHIVSASESECIFVFSVCINI